MVVDPSLLPTTFFPQLSYSSSLRDAASFSTPPSTLSWNSRKDKSHNGWERWVFSVHKELKWGWSTFQRKPQILFSLFTKKGYLWRVPLEYLLSSKRDLQDEALGLKPKDSGVFIFSLLSVYVGGGWKVRFGGVEGREQGGKATGRAFSLFFPTP